jgi:hypothetical protein
MQKMTRLILAALIVPVCLNAFVARRGFRSRATHPVSTIIACRSTQTSDAVRVGDLLSDLPTPSLMIELSLAEGAVGKDNNPLSLDDILKDTKYLSTSNISLDGALFIHTKVADTSVRDAITEEQGSGKSHVICQVDALPTLIPGGAFLGIGLANHHVGGYYWARGMGIGASLPAHGIHFRACEDSENGGELYWRKRGPGVDARETTEDSSNSNDGKRSEWADFVAVGDTVQLVPEDAAEVMKNSPFSTLLGVRRIGRPLGADPIVEKVWIRSESGDGGWVAK